MGGGSPAKNKASLLGGFVFGVPCSEFQVTGWSIDRPVPPTCHVVAGRLAIAKADLSRRSSSERRRMPADHKAITSCLSSRGHTIIRISMNGLGITVLPPPYTWEHGGLRCSVGPHPDIVLGLKCFGIRIRVQLQFFPRWNIRYRSLS